MLRVLFKWLKTACWFGLIKTVLSPEAILTFPVAKVTATSSSSGYALMLKDVSQYCGGDIPRSYHKRLVLLFLTTSKKASPISSTSLGIPLKNVLENTRYFPNSKQLWSHRPNVHIQFFDPILVRSTIFSSGFLAGHPHLTNCRPQHKSL